VWKRAVVLNCAAVWKRAGELTCAALFLVLTAPACGGREAVIISEFMATNAATLQDRDGEYSDWIELYNSGNTTVDLESWHLTDSIDQPRRWRFPLVQLPAHEYLVVFASGKNHAVPTEQLHTDFKLKALSDYLALVRPGGSVATEFRPAYPDQYNDISFGLTAEGTLDFLARATPGEANSEARPKGSAAAATGRASVEEED
jgi:hypothetical protein